MADAVDRVVRDARYIRPARLASPPQKIRRPSAYRLRHHLLDPPLFDRVHPGRPARRPLWINDPDGTFDIADSEHSRFCRGDHFYDLAPAVSEQCSVERG